MFPHFTPRVTVFFCLILLVVSAVQAQIIGKVVNKETQEEIVGANVLIVNTNTGTTTDDKGVFSFDWQGDFLRVEHSGAVAGADARHRGRGGLRGGVQYRGYHCYVTAFWWGPNTELL